MAEVLGGKWRWHSGEVVCEGIVDLGVLEFKVEVLIEGLGEDVRKTSGNVANPIDSVVSVQDREIFARDDRVEPRLRREQGGDELPEDLENQLVREAGELRTQRRDHSWNDDLRH